MEEIIKGIYRVADCEHHGDMDSSASYLRSIGCNVIDSHWDGEDCGDAYIRFTFKSSKFKAIYDEIGCSATFSRNINDYIKFDDKIKGFERLSLHDFNSMKKNLLCDYKDGFEKRIPILLFFDKKDNINPNDIINEILSNFKEYESVGYKIEMVDGVTYFTFLFTIDYMELQYNVFKKIGDYCLSHKNSIIKRHGLYGECRPCHNIFDICNFDYELTRRLIQKILNKENIIYSRCTSFNQVPYMEVPYKDYMVNGEIKKYIKGFNGNTYSLDKHYIK